MQTCASSRSCVSSCEACAAYSPHPPTSTLQKCSSQVALEDLSDNESIDERPRQFGRSRTAGAYGFGGMNMSRNLSKNKSINIGGAKNLNMRSQRGTFVFDRVLYRDSIIEITPSSLFFLRSRRRLGNGNGSKGNNKLKCIDIMHIENVHIRAHISVPLLKPTWRQRFSWSNNVRARAPLTGRIPNVLLDISNYGILGIFVDRPLQVKEAILSARNHVY